MRLSKARIGKRGLLLAMVACVSTLVGVVAAQAAGGQATAGELATDLVNGRWEIVDTNGDVVVWEAVNVRTDRTTGFPLAANQVEDIAERFNAVRLVAHWEQLEPSEDQYNATLQGQICSFLNLASANDLMVILDATHFGGTEGNIPGWVWDDLLPNENVRARNTAFPIFADVLRDDDTHWLDYIDWLMSGATCSGPNGQTTLGTHPAVVAFELLNEVTPPRNITAETGPPAQYLSSPIPPGVTVATGDAKSDFSQGWLMMIFDRAISEVRSHGRPNIPVVPGAFLGGHLHDNDAAATNVNWLRALTEQGFVGTASSSGNGTHGPPPNLTVSIEDPQNPHDNLIWTAHSYFTGVSEDSNGSCQDGDLVCLVEGEGEDYDGDGLADPDGQKNDGIRSGGLWTEQFNSVGCYGYPQPGRTNCPALGGIGDARRQVARTGLQANLWNHDRIAQDAEMPLFLGEWGIGEPNPDPSRDINTGWGNAAEFVCDRLISFTQVRPATQSAGGETVSWAAWAFDDRSDGRFGLYDGSASQWRGFADSFIDPDCRNDVDADEVPDVIDNCPSVANPGQQDANGNGVGDACETNGNSPKCHGLVPTVDIGAGDVPTVGDDVILGTEGADVINALSGDDIICSRGGDDVVFGGNGIDLISGGDGNDRISGQGGNDRLYGEFGNDLINGGVGDDEIWGGRGDDDLRGQGGADTLRGEDGVDQFFGGSGNDTIDTGDGGNAGTTQVVRGQSNNDIITGSPQSDVLEGGPGLDELFGEGGDDLLSGGNASDDLYGGPGNDTLEGGASRDFLFGGTGDDDLAGGTGDDDLFGEGGNDSLNGQGDNDLCDGGVDTDAATALCETLVSVP